MGDLFTEFPSLTLELRPGFVLPAIQNYKLSPYRVEEVLSDNSLTQFVKLGILVEIRQIQIFSSPPNYIGAIHIDGSNPSTQEGAINWVCNETADSNWSTEWGYSKNTPTTSNIKSGPGSAIYFDPETFEVVKTWDGPSSIPTLIHVGVPHRIVNRSSKIRHCVSIRFTSKHNYHSLKSVISGHS